MIISCALSIILVSAQALAGDPVLDTCNVIKDIDINPHTPGLGHMPASSIDECCQACASQEWWERGCRFYTLSKGNCWFKADNGTMAPSPGKLSGQATKEGPPPPAPPPWPKTGTSGWWKKIGPWGIGDDIDAQGEAGTLADAVSPPMNPKVIYAGGQNNGASSGVLKSIDGGQHWSVASRGMFNTRVQALGIADQMGDHVYCAVPGAIYETVDGAQSWHLVNGSSAFGTCHTFKNGTINNEPYMFASCDIGIANIPMGRPGNWSVIAPGGWGRAGYLTLSDSLRNNSVLGGCLGGYVWIGTVVNTTYANWTTFPDRPCVMLALNPNDKDHFIYTHPPITYQSMDGGKTFENLNHSNIFHCGIDRRGWLYTAAMGGAFVSKDCGPGPGMKRPCSWEGYYDKRVQRRTNASMVRGAHDYQRISLDFGNEGYPESTGISSVAFSSDQGLFIKPLNSSSLELIKANGNMSNNIALKACVSKGDGTPGGRHIVTAVWDWAPLASWDSGSHWPSWQAPDGYSGSCIGEGGGAYGMGASNRMLLMHHHNIMASSLGGKNLSRFVVPHGATVFGPAYQSLADGTVEGRTMPNGAVYAPLFFGGIPFVQRDDQVLATPGFEANCTDITKDLTQQTNYSCLATIDLGTSYGWYTSVNYAFYDTDKTCHVCSLSGNVSLWTYANKTGVISYSQPPSLAARARRETASLMARLDFDGDGRIDAHDLDRSMVNDSWAVQEEQARDRLVRHRQRARETPDQKLDRHLSAMSQHDRAGTMTGRLPRLHTDTDYANGFENGVDLGGGQQFIIKNYNYGVGMNWTWTRLPPHLAAIHSFSTDPTSNKTIYAVASNCIAKSHDGGDTWDPCWNATNLTGSFGDLVIKNSSTMIVVRSGAVPLRTFDGGETWQPMTSATLVASFSHGVLWSWTGNTLMMLGSGGTQSDEHPHSAYVWKSTDDGDTWTDETGDLVTMGPGAAQWYENDFYINSMGQGIQVKTLE